VASSILEEHPGIVDKDVEAGKTADHGRDRRAPILLASDVEMAVDGLATGILERTHGLAPALLQHVADGDLGSRLDHLSRSFRADPARRSGYQRDLAVEPVHLRFPFFPTLGEQPRT
jgi:hypothetical protein